MEPLVHVKSEHGSISCFFSLIHKSEFEEIDKNSTQHFHLPVSKFLPQTDTRPGLVTEMKKNIKSESRNCHKVN